MTSELVSVRLYKDEIDERLAYPAADNTYGYQDSHKVLYGYLIDGLDKQCISALASRLGTTVNVGNKNTIQAITMSFPKLQTSPNFMSAMNLVSDQCRRASHGVRPPAENFPAFSQFTKDLYLCLEAAKELLAMLEHEFGVDGEEVRDHHESKTLLPQIDRPAGSHYSIVQAARMQGKTVEKVDFGFRAKIKGVHESEALVIHFTDGSIMSLETGSNLANVAANETSLNPEDFHVDLIVHGVSRLPRV